MPMADAPLYSATATFLNMDDTICMAIIFELEATVLAFSTYSGQIHHIYFPILLQCTLPENRKIQQAVKWKELSI